MSKMNPWAGLSSYQEGDGRQFCGRDNESFDVARLVDNNIFVTLYGKSGIGKSSLLNAGVFPRLRSRGYLPVSVRLGIEAADGRLQACIVSRLDEALREAEGAVKETPVVPIPEDDQAETWLWSYFARRRFVDSEGRTLFPVLVFDQFEEIFRSHPEEAGRLLRQIQFMMDESHALPDTEEYSYDFNFRFLVSIREDELYRLEDSLDAQYLPEMKKCRYRLRGLSPEGMRDVILIPGAPYITEKDREEVVKAVTELATNPGDGSISTNILSLVCSRSFDEMAGKGLEHIDGPLVEGMKADNLFEKYYQEALEGFPKKATQFIEDNLIDSDERRNSVSESDFFRAVPGGEALIEEGPRKILQRVSAASGSNLTRIELVHDSFCEPIARLRKKRQQKKKTVLATVFALAAIAIFAVSAVIIHSMRQREWKMLENQSRFVAEKARALVDEGDAYTAMKLAVAVLPGNVNHPDRPFVPEAEGALRKAWTREQDAIIRGFDNSVHSVSLSPDGKRLVTAALDGAVKVWDTWTGKLVAVLDSLDFSGEAMYDPAGDRIIGHHGDGLKVWDANSFQLLPRTWPEGLFADSKYIDCYITDWKYSPDGHCLQFITTYSFYSVDAKDYHVLQHFEFEERLKSFSVSPDGSKLAFTFDLYDYDPSKRPTTLIVMDSEGKVIEEKKYLDDYSLIDAVSFSSDNSSLLFPSEYYLHGKYALVEIDLKNGEEKVWGVDERDLHQGWVSDIQRFNGKGKGDSYATASRDGTVRIWNDSITKQTFYGNGGWIDDIDISPDGRILAADENVSVHLWGLSDGVTEIWEDHIPVQRDSILMSPDKSRYVLGNHVSIKMFDASNDSLLFSIPFAYFENPVAFSPDGNSFITISFKNSSLHIYESSNGNPVWVCDGFNLASRAAAYHPDGEIIAAGCKEPQNSIVLFDTKNKSYKEYPQKAKVEAIAYSHSGKYLSFLSAGSLHVLEASSMVEVASAPGFYYFPDTKLYFSDDDRQILFERSSTSGHRIRIFDFPTLQELIDRTRERFKEVPLTPEERKQYYLE